MDGYGGWGERRRRRRRGHLRRLTSLSGTATRRGGDDATGSGRIRVLIGQGGKLAIPIKLFEIVGSSRITSKSAINYFPKPSLETN